MHRIYCDGSCFPNPGGPGGWGVWIESTGGAAYGGEPVTTNNRMEMQALIEALKLAPGDKESIIFSDSQYVVNGSMSWRHKWERNGWKMGRMPESKPVKNADLWVSIAENMRLKPLARVEWVRGHSGIEGNERADELAGLGRQQAMEEEHAFA